MIAGGAKFSDDTVCRYDLWRRWAPGPLLRFILLNPSTADAVQDDATSRRGASFARRERAAGYAFTNLFGYRATDPRELQRVEDPFGSENDDWIFRAGMRAESDGLPIICAWGVHGSLRGADARAMTILRMTGAKLMCLGKTKHGHPKHILYLAKTKPREPFP